MSHNLKPCPFCGTRLIVSLDHPDAAEHPYGDGDCILAGSGITDDQFSAWNTRAEVKAAVKRALEGAAIEVEQTYIKSSPLHKIGVTAADNIRRLDPALFIEGDKT